jgi:hypothetical protein
MTRLTLLLGAALAATVSASPAAEFPLEFKTMSAWEAMVFRGGSGIYAKVSANKAGDIVKEPAAVSKQPLYGELGHGNTAFAFRLDETQGDGKSYDRLIVDLNRNGDLTDDPVIAAVVGTNRAASQQRRIFGPIPAPEDKKIGDWRPFYFAELYLYSLPANINVSMPLMGQLRLKAGWYLETVAEFDGMKRRVALADGNCNFRLGDVSTPTTYGRAGQTNWYFQNGDGFVQDVNDSGKYEYSPLNPESFPYSPIVYVGAKPYKIALTADCKSLVVEPWSEPLAELAVQPHGEQVSSLELAWEKEPGQWQLLQASVTDGKARVPPGNYRLYACTLKATTAKGETLVLEGYRRAAEGGTQAEAGKRTLFMCGAPLEAKVTSERDTRSGIVVGESNTLLGRLLRRATRTDEPLKQRIEARLVGAGGESYSDFMQVSKNDVVEPPEPTFTITSSDGKLLASGKLEYG